MKALRIHDNRTYNKHFNKLIELNWINLNERSGIYHIRGFDRLRIEYNIRSKQATTLFYKHLKILDVFLVGVLLCAEVNKQKYFWEVVVRRKLRPVANKRDATNPARVYADRPNQSITVLVCHKLPKCLDAVKRGLLNSGKKPPMPDLSKPIQIHGNNPPAKTRL